MRLWVLASLLGMQTWAAELEFNRDIRPILSDKCYHCHGPDAVAKKIPLRLDSEQAAKADLGGRRAIVAGHPEQSAMVQRITSDNKALRMPPVYSGHTLSATQIETLRSWIEQGAKWQQHWSFIAPQRLDQPAVKNASWVKNPIDAFILARLERQGIAPSPEASRETLLRRVSLDLTGLPPSPAEIDAFLADASPNAYERVVDRLLASPRYGERMAARWLDAARYADSNGYQYDGERMMWRWRDWVIESFNRNQPFNQFTLEQIAGDMLPNATVDRKIATGFSRNHRANTEDGIIAEEYAVEYVVDRIETTSAVFLGLTLGCTRCHNHKYDPFTQKEFYQLYGYFNNIAELGRAMKYGNSPPLVAAPAREQQQQLDALNRRISALDERLRSQAREIDAAQANWQRAARAESRHWTPSSELNAAYPLESAGEVKTPYGEVAFVPGRLGLAARFDGKSFLEAAGAAAFDIDDRFTLSGWVYSDAVPEGAFLSRMADTARGKGFGIYCNNGKIHVHITSNYADDAIRADTGPVLAAGQWHHITATYSGSRMAEGVHVWVDGKPVTFKVDLDTLYRPFRNAGSVFKQPFRIGAGGGMERRFRGLIDDVRVYSRVLADEEIAALSLGRPVRALTTQTAAERDALRWFFLENVAAPEIQETWKNRVALVREKEALERTFPTVMVMAEQPQRKPAHFLIRGAYDKKGEIVESGVPAILPPLPEGAPNNRLGFARWLTDSSNPLLARVTVNRFWQALFGVGIVKTTEDFGSQGEWPSHPELLDWLATEFIRSGWDVKAMHKSIVTSAAYRQSSKASPDLVSHDPENRLIARGPRHRLPAEMIRDQALFAAGLLHEKQGGPSVKPYQPAGLWKELAMQDMDYVQSKPPDLYRRGLYTFWKRTIAPPMMVNFDSANREACVVRETRTNTPLQALNLMNDVTFLEAARFIGQRMMKEGGSGQASRLQYGFRLITGRKPLDPELQVLQDNFRYHLDYFADSADKVKSYLSHGDSPVDPILDSRELAAYASVASVILNLDEAVTKE
jgi:hypothetical protein